MTLAVAPGSLVSTVAPTAARERLLSLDVFRGMTVAGMLLVNNPGSWGAIYPPLAHAAWHGWTPTDLIFPFFLFIVGITTHLSLSARRQRGDDERAIVRQILRRGGLIILFGLALSAFPFYQWGPIEGMADPSIAQRIAYRFAHLRIPGVLQRIGVVYIIAALLTLRGSLTRHVAIAAALLIGYWIVMTALPVPDHGILGALVLHEPSMTMAAWSDRLLLNGHLWAATRTWDPEGVLSTVPAVGTAMLGVFAGRWIGTPRSLPERIAGLCVAGALAIAVGSMWGWVFPINKPLWTSSYVLFTGGMACLTLGVCMWVIDEHRVTGWTRPFVPFGINPMIAFVGSGLMARLIYTLWRVEYEGQVVSVQAAVYRSLYASWLAPRNASLLFALSFVMLWLGILSLLRRRNIILKL